MLKLAVEDLAWLLTAAGEAALAKAQSFQDPLQAAMALRKDLSPARAAAVLEVSAARARATLKFGSLAAELIADVSGVAQATSLRVAAYKATRMRSLGLPVVDLTSGIGADALALAAGGAEVLAIDLDPARAFMTQCQAKVPTAIADAAAVRTSGYAIHLDPARRTADKRLFDLDDFAPGPLVWQARLTESRAGLIKLGPGLPFDRLKIEGEGEIVSEDGRLVAAHLWTGPLQSAERRATLFRGEERYSFAGRPEPLTESGAPAQFGAYVFEPDDALERAELLLPFAKATNLELSHPGLGLLTGAQPIASPWLRAHEVLDVFPFQEKRLRARLREFEGLPLIVKVRGKAVPDPTEFERRFTAAHRGATGDPTVVFILRAGKERLALLTRRRLGG